MIKVCRRCGAEGAAGGTGSQFWKDRTRPDGFSHWCKACKKWQAQNHREAHLDEERAYHRRATRLYRMRSMGWDVDLYEQLVEKHGETCAICDAGPPPNGGLAIDHDHETGEPRGLLCTACNVGIGNLADSPDRLLSAWAYLTKSAVTSAAIS